jgi:hypothetical protein
MRIDTRPDGSLGADSTEPVVPLIAWRREMLTANSIDHHARDRVITVVCPAALRTPATDDDQVRVAPPASGNVRRSVIVPSGHPRSVSRRASFHAQGVVRVADEISAPPHGERQSWTLADGFA